MLDVTVSNKFAQEKIVLTFNFANELAASETLSGAITVTVEVVKGVDASPSSMLNGAAAYDATAKKVLQAIQGGIAGNTYRIKTIAPTTNAQKVLGRSAIITIE
jgi:hypothetical protein